MCKRLSLCVRVVACFASAVKLVRSMTQGKRISRWCGEYVPGTRTRGSSQAD